MFILSLLVFDILDDDDDIVTLLLLLTILLTTLLLFLPLRLLLPFPPLLTPTNPLTIFFNLILHPTAISFHESISYYLVSHNLYMEQIFLSLSFYYNPYNFCYLNFSTNSLLLSKCFYYYSFCLCKDFCYCLLLSVILEVVLLNSPPFVVLVLFLNVDDANVWFIYSFSFFFWVTYDRNKDNFCYSFVVYSFNNAGVSFIGLTFLIDDDMDGLFIYL